ncbi:hypothetical protein LGW95_09700, partial [Streptococcus mutans]|nr:hypothetical protein [Streptococcus mutans]
LVFQFIDENFIFISQFHNKNTPKVRFFLSNFWGAVHILSLFYDKLDQGKQLIITSHQFDFLVPEKTQIIFIEDKQIKFNDSLTAFLAYYHSFGQAFDIQ